MPPFYMNSTGAAARAFEDSVNDSSHAFNKHPADYTLFEIGTFNDQNAEITLLELRINIANAIEVLTDLPQHLKPQSD